MDRLTLLETFARIAERGSISAAARDLSISQASASRQLQELEARVGVELIRRTTHSLTVTDAGETCLGEARRLLSGWDGMLEDLSAMDSEVSGRLHVVAPVALGQHYLADAMLDFQQGNPGLEVVWQLQDEPVSFIESGCDVWLKVGTVPDDRLVVRSLGSVERLVVAAPSLVTSKQSIRTIEALPCVAVSPFEGGTIPLFSKGGNSHTLKAKPTMTTNNIVAAREAALRGIGYAVMPRWFVNKELDQGMLMDVLPTWRAPALDIVAAYLPQRRQTRRVKLCLAHMASAVLAIPGIAVPPA